MCTCRFLAPQNIQDAKCAARGFSEWQARLCERAGWTAGKTSGQFAQKARNRDLSYRGKDEDKTPRVRGAGGASPAPTNGFRG